MWIFLSGPMGSGKSTLAGGVAEGLGLPVFDLDRVVERRAGRSVSQIFEREGESAFRELEAAALDQLLTRERGGVLSLGGGTVTSQSVRRRLLEAGMLITLIAEPQVLAARVGRGRGRPLLNGRDPEERLRELLAARAVAYAECHARIDTGTRPPQEIVEQLLELARRTIVVVPLGLRSYPVEVGAGVRARISGLVAERVVVVTDSNVGPRWGQEVADAIRRAGRSATVVTLPAGEEHKRLASVERIWDEALSFGVDRKAMIVGVGGGVVGDMAGFAAASLLRGVAVGHMPTTLLSMVDSSIGGKTGFDTRHGKNLVGAFHQPSFVLADVDTLTTLPREERVSGFAEIVKSAWIEGDQAISELERDVEPLSAADPEATARAIGMCCRMKTRIVTEDEREAGLRAVLNLGHTVGHAIEAAEGFRLRHGECVALGMVAACRVARHLGHMEASTERRMCDLLGRLGLPVDVLPHLQERTLAFMAADKKRSGDGVTYVLPGEPGTIELKRIPLSDLTQMLRP